LLYEKELINCSDIFLLFHHSYSQAGALDPSFGQNGIVSTDFGAEHNIYNTTPGTVLTDTGGMIYLVLQVNFQTLITGSVVMVLQILLMEIMVIHNRFVFQVLMVLYKVMKVSGCGR
jgi:hypothetical protein